MKTHCLRILRRQLEHCLSSDMTIEKIFEAEAIITAMGGELSKIPRCPRGMMENLYFGVRLCDDFKRSQKLMALIITTLAKYFENSGDEKKVTILDQLQNLYCRWMKIIQLLPCSLQKELLGNYKIVLNLLEELFPEHGIANNRVILPNITSYAQTAYVV